MDHQEKILPNHILISQVRQLIQEGRSVRFRVRGNSMRPFIEHERDEVLLLPPQPSALRCGDVVLAETSPDFFVLHRIIQTTENDGLVLQGDGNVTQVEHCTRNDVIGIATGFYRKGRTRMDSVHDKKWRIYSTLWKWLSPMRRYLLSAYRRVWLPFFNPF